MSKKRTSLDSILAHAVEAPRREPQVDMRTPATPDSAGQRPGVKQQTAYLKLPVYEQLRRLAFEERGKMHDYILEGLDLVFRKRGLPGIDELDRKGA